MIAQPTGRPHSLPEPSRPNPIQPGRKRDGAVEHPWLELVLWIFEGRRPDTEGDSTRFRPFTPEQRIRWMQEHAPRTLAWITVNHRWPELTEL